MVKLASSSLKINSYSGLSFIGELCKAHVRIEDAPDSRSVIGNDDIIRSMIGLLCQSHCSYEDIELYRHDRDFASLLQMHHIPSSCVNVWIN